MNVKRLSRSLILWISLAVVLAVFGFAFTFRDINDTSKPPPVVPPSNGATR